MNSIETKRLRGELKLYVIFHCLILLDINIYPLNILRLANSRLLVLIAVFVCALPPLNAAEIIWDKSSLTLVQERGGYGRMIRLNSGNILCSYECAREVRVRASKDNGSTWEPGVLVARYPHGTAANPEIIQLRNDRVLCFYNERPRNGSKMPFTIMVSASKDSGNTWSSPKQLYRAGREFKNGCWEPAAIQLPSGEIQLFFANEGPYRSSAEQEIALMRSQDNGLTWSKPERISFRAYHRDGMPVPLVLKNEKGIIVAIEDNGMNGKFKPVILHTSITNKWRDGYIAGNSPRRWSALKTDLPRNVYAGAPYICQLPSGTTVISIQSNEGGRKEPQMVVYLGDNHAKNFAAKSVPFAIASDVGGKWNSLFVKNATTVTAISSTTIDGVRGLWAVDGQVQNQEK